MNDTPDTPAAPATDSGWMALYPGLSQQIDATDSAKQLATVVRFIVEELPKRVPTSKVLQAAKAVGATLIAALANVGDETEFAKTRIMAKKQVLFLLTVMKEEAAAQTAASETAAPPPPPFTVEADTIDKFLPAFLGRYMGYALAPFRPDPPMAVPERLPWFMTEGGAERLGQAVEQHVAPFLLESRVLKVRLVENFNVKEKGVAGMLSFLVQPKDNPIHYVWDNLWQPPATQAAKGSSDQRRSQMVRDAMQTIAGPGGPALDGRDLAIIRMLVRLDPAVVVEEQGVLKDSIAKARGGQLRPTFVRERIEKMIQDTLPPPCGEMLLLRMMASHPDYFNAEWIKWFVAGFRDRKDAVALFQRWHPEIRAVTG